MNVGLEMPPEPGVVSSVDELSRALNQLRVWAGSPSYALLAAAIGELRAARGDHRRPGKVTVYDCFREGRKRLDAQLFADLIEVLGLPRRAQQAWFQAYRNAVGQEVSASNWSGASAQLPPPRTRLIGRDAELADLLVQGPGSISVIVGLAGVGKTELAVHVANRWLRQLGPTAVGLALDLRGFDPDLPPLPSASVLARLLGAVGVPASRFDGLAAFSMAELLREVLGSRPVVLVLDNAHSAKQVIPLLPIAGRWRLLVTSRRRLPELEISAAATVVLAELSDQAAVQVLAGEIGLARIAAEPTAATQIAARCGRLALDLRLAGAAIAKESADWTLADHVARLAALPADELIRPALWLSYQALTTPVRKLLRLAALHPGPWISHSHLVAMADLSDVVVAEQVGVLLGEHLLAETASGYVLHDLVQAFGLRQATLEDPRSQQVGAVRRLMNALIAEAQEHATAGRPDSDWLEDHLPVVQALTTAAADWGLGDERSRLVLLYSEFLETSGRLAVAEDLIRLALTTAGGAEPVLRRKLGRVLELRGDLETALEELRKAAQPENPEYGRALNGLGNVSKRLGRHRDAVTYYCRAARHAAGPMDHGRALGNLADTLRLVEHAAIAAPIFEAAEQLSRQAEDVVALAILAGNRCILVEEQGHSVEAAALARASARQFDELGFVAPSLTVQQVVIRGLIASGELDEAEKVLAAATQTARETGSALISCELRLARASLQSARGQAGLARTELEDTIAEADRIGVVPLAIRAYVRLGELLAGTGELAEAADAYQAAAALAAATGDRRESMRVQRALSEVRGRAALATARTNR